MKPIKLAIIGLGLAAARPCLGVNMAFDPSPVPRCYIFDWSDSFGWQSGGSYSNHAAIAGQAVIAYNRVDAEKATGFVSFEDPSIKYFLICGTNFAFAGTTQQKFMGYMIRFKTYHEGSWLTADDGTFVLTDYTGTTPLLSYNYSTGQLQVYPNAKMPDKLYEAKSSAQAGGGLVKEIQVSVINAVQDDCRRIDVGKLRKVKGMMVASAVASGIGAVGGAVATGFNIAGAKSAKNAEKAEAARQSAETENADGNADAGDPNQNESANEKKFDVAGAAKTVNTVSSAANIATGATSAVLSGMSAGEIDKIIEQVEKCKSAAGKL
ncbi:MAG: hypothetical protein LBL21_00595 [Rickettsiales bacterium]|nr:hypothetical protein [Rickettsiales bacterium]